MKILAIVKEVAPDADSLDNEMFEVVVGERTIVVANKADANYYAGIINVAFDHAIADAENAAHSEGYDMGYQAAINFVAAGE
jgi:hypothetical protein